MAEKQDLKESESKILVYLEVADIPLKTILKMSSKLKMDYSYSCKIIQAMIDKKWIYKKTGVLRSYYFITLKAPIKQAKEMLSK